MLTKHDVTVTLGWQDSSAIIVLIPKEERAGRLVIVFLLQCVLVPLSLGVMCWSVIFGHIHLFLFQDYVAPRLFFMLKSTEHEIPTKNLNAKHRLVYIFKLSAVAFIMLMNVKLPTIVIMLIMVIKSR